jgi:surfactin synthase thioesterase subunit
MTGLASTRTTEAASLLHCAVPQRDARLRLVCFAHAGGSDGAYRRWVRALAPQVEIWTGSLPGRARRAGETFVRSWDGLAEPFAADCEAVSNGRPVAILGHSMGGLIAFEVARAMERRGRLAPAHLIVSGCRAPDRLDPNRHVPTGDDELVEAVDGRYGALPPIVKAEPELMRRFLPVLRADLELAAAYAYVPAEPLSCHITALGGTDDVAARPPDLDGWAAHTSAACTTRVLPGGHFFIHDELATTAGVVRQALLSGGA